MKKRVKKKQAVPNAAQADPETVGESEEDIFGEEHDELEEVEDFEEVKPNLVFIPDEEPVKEELEDLPLNQVPGKLRKFLTKKD